MTILESIKCVLSGQKDGLTSREIYLKIIDRNLYTFGAQNPLGVVNGRIRRHCIGLDFPTAHHLKYFKIVKQVKKTNYYALIDSSTEAFTPVRESVAEILPEERIQHAFEDHIRIIQNQVLEITLQAPPTFFEHLVVDLLLKMGYGYDKHSGVVVGGPHDGGVDGKIYEDKLELDTIYLQAKRYDRNKKISRKEIQAFVGAMENIQKGVFITTSSFSKEAINYTRKQQQKSLKLIAGEYLSELMVKYEVGISTVKSLNIYKIDQDYFVDN